MASPFLLPQRSVISFSGGRTSGFMLWKVLEVFGGVLPYWIKVIFCNTGKEREETLDFVERCSQRWSVPITWLEYRWEPGRHYFVEVDYATASRNGEPFEMVIQARSFLPNPIMRFCTAEMKIRTTNRYLHSIGWTEYTNAIGFRSDEPNRVAKLFRKRKVEYIPTLWEDWIIKEESRGADPPPGETPVTPLFDAGLSKDDVMGFWGGQRCGADLDAWLATPKAERRGWDLELRQDEGNCDLCFLKGASKILRLIKDRPESAEWWAEKERQLVGIARGDAGATFRSDRPRYAELLEIATGKQEGPGWLWADGGNDGSCGEIDECRCTD